MDERIPCIIALSLFVLPLAQATSTCPANDPHIGPYNRVEILPKGYKLVNEEFTVKAVRIDERVEKPLSGRSVKIFYYTTDTREELVASGSTNSRGEYKYTPTKLGRYKVECASKAPTFEVKRLLDDPTDFGAVCGNGICEDDKMEDAENCPADCSVCGNAVCEPGENKESCPDDCVICGDGVCDDPEIGATQCYCAVDCIVCGDGICRDEYGEECPEDCGGAAEAEEGADQGLLEAYWWVFAIGGVVGVSLVIGHLRGWPGGGEDEGDEAGKKKQKKKKQKSGKKAVVAEKDDEDVREIIQELMENGMSEKRIKGKLKEFGLEGKEAEELVKEAKK